MDKRSLPATPASPRLPTRHARPPVRSNTAANPSFRSQFLQIMSKEQRHRRQLPSSAIAFLTAPVTCLVAPIARPAVQEARDCRTGWDGRCMPYRGGLEPGVPRGGSCSTVWNSRREARPITLLTLVYNLIPRPLPLNVICFCLPLDPHRPAITPDITSSDNSFSTASSSEKGRTNTSFVASLFTKKGGQRNPTQLLSPRVGTT